VFNKYYQDELAYLREIGQEFARAYPDAAHFIGEASRDPDVERLLEGFAFLTARVRQKLDDELPEVTHDLIEMFWPHYLRPVPSMTVLQFEPLPQAAREVRPFPRGVEAVSVPVDGTVCRFRTIYDVPVVPLKLENASLRAEAPPQLRLRLRLPEGVALKKLNLTSLRLHLAGDTAASRGLYFCLCRHLKRVWAQPAGSGAPTALEGASVRPLGFSPAEAMLPYPAVSLHGFRLLQEYFAFPAKFLFVDAVGLEGLAALPPAPTFDLVFEFSRLPDAMPPITAANVLLNCAPAINLFRHSAEPIRLDHERVEYPVRPVGGEGAHYEIYAIDKVTGLVKGSGRAQEYRPLLRFARPPDEDVLFYRQRVDVSVTGEGSDLYVSPLPPSAPGALPEIETLSLDITCTNRQLPSKLQIGDVSTLPGAAGTIARVRNVVRPAPSIPAPLGGDLHWRLLSHLAVNYLSLADLEALRAILGLYHFRARVDRQAEQALRHLLQGIQKISALPSVRLLEGTPVRGMSVEVEMDESHFGGEGEVYLFGSLLNEVYSQFVTVNAFCHLKVRGLKFGEIHEWPTRIGDRIIL
jgi:type VI secretion system protein ImpG